MRQLTFVAREDFPGKSIYWFVAELTARSRVFGVLEYRSATTNPDGSPADPYVVLESIIDYQGISNLPDLTISELDQIVTDEDVQTYIRQNRRVYSD